MGKFLRIAGVCLLAVSSQSSALAAECTRWADLAIDGLTRMTVMGGPARNEFELTGKFAYRPLLAESKFFWRGFQILDPLTTVDGNEQTSLIYGVPFAVKIDAESHEIMGYQFAADLEPEDRSKLQSIYQGLHLTRPTATEDPTDYTMRDRDDLGVFEASIKHQDGSFTKAKRRYVIVGDQASDNELMSISAVNINSDETLLQQDNCWITDASGTSDIEIATGNNLITIHVEQSMSHALRSDAVRLDAMLLSLPLNPEEWQMIPEVAIYPPPPRNPLADADAFLKALSALDLTNMASKDILQFLYDNDVYLPLLKDPIAESVFPDDFESRLLLMIGKNDSSNSHLLITELFTDDSVNDRARFRSLMALKYAENAIDPELIERFFVSDPARTTSENVELMQAAMLALGIVARNQLETESGQYLSNRLGTELRASTDPQNTAALLTAIGNTGDVSKQPLLVDYLENDDPLLRQRSAAALGSMPGDGSVATLSGLLEDESDPKVQGAALKSLGANRLPAEQISQVYEFAASSTQTRVRHAAILALSNQVDTTPDVKQDLRALLKSEKDRTNLRAILQVLY